LAAAAAASMAAMPNVPALRAQLRAIDRPVIKRPLIGTIPC
jgi:hypothetical protein